MIALGTRPRVEEFARLLDGAVAGPDARTAHQAALAARLRALAPATEVAPRAEFRAALRTRLVAVATVQEATPVPRPRAASWTQSRKGQRGAGVLAGSMAGIIAFTGISIASSQSLPGAPFYGLKRGAETVQLQFARGDLAKGTAHLEFAATRLREVQALTRGQHTISAGPGSMTLAGGRVIRAGSTTPAGSVAMGRSLQSRLTDTLADFDDETRAGNALLLAVYHDNGKVEPLRILSRFSAEQSSRLTALLPALPGGVAASARHSLALVTEVGQNATEMLALVSCSAACHPLGTSRSGRCQCPSSTPSAPAGATRTPGPGTTGPTSQATGPSTPHGPRVPTTAPSTDPLSPPEGPPPGNDPLPLPTAVVPLPTVLPLPLPTLPVPLPTGLGGVLG